LIPFVDLKAQYLSIKHEIDPAVLNVFDTTQFVLGSAVAGFEKAFAPYCGSEHAVGVNSGTSAIQLALQAAGIGRGDEVITTPFTFVATVYAIDITGATPVFVDIDPSSLTIDPAKIEAAITPRTKAIVPVHLHGRPADMDPILEIGKRRNVLVIEDAAQAHGAEYKGRRIGSLGAMACFSFYPGKNLGAYGDAGAIITNDDALARKARLFACHGSLQKYLHEIEGINSRIDGIQAAVLTVKLKHIDDWNKARHAHGLKYNALLAGVPDVKTPALRDKAFHIFHIYALQAPRREQLAEHLKAKGISTGIHYPTALPFMPAYSYLNHKPSDFPVAHREQDKILSLPMYPELTDEQIEYTVQTIREFYSK